MEDGFVSCWLLALYEHLHFPFKPTGCWFKTKAPFLGVQRAVGFKGTNDFIIQLHESFFFCLYFRKYCRHYFNASMILGNIVQIVFSSCAVKKLPSISDFSSVAVPF